VLICVSLHVYSGEGLEQLMASPQLSMEQEHVEDVGTVWGASVAKCACGAWKVAPSPTTCNNIHVRVCKE